LITQQVVHARPSGNHQQQSTHLPTTTDASSRRSTTDSKDHDRITLCGILWCGRGVWGTTVGGMDRPRRAHVRAETVASQIWVPSN